MSLHSHHQGCTDYGVVIFSCKLTFSRSIPTRVGARGGGGVGATYNTQCKILSFTSLHVHTIQHVAVSLQIGLSLSTLPRKKHGSTCSCSVKPIKWAHSVDAVNRDRYADLVVAKNAWSLCTEYRAASRSLLVDYFVCMGVGLLRKMRRKSSRSLL